MIDIKQMAKLARIKLSPEEESILEEQMNLIIGYVEQLNEVGPLSVEPLNNGHEEAQTLRTDDVVDWKESSLALDNAPDRCGNLFKVPPVI